MVDYIQGKGAAALGTRLRRLSEQMDREVQQAYRDHGVRFEPRWFPIVSALAEHGSLTVGGLADLIGVSHAAVSQLRSELVAARLVRSRADPEDGRRQMLMLTVHGKREVDALRPLWGAIAQAALDLCREAAPDFLEDLERIETALKEKPMQQRIELGRSATRINRA